MSATEPGYLRRPCCGASIRWDVVLRATGPTLLPHARHCPARA